MNLKKVTQRRNQRKLVITPKFRAAWRSKRSAKETELNEIETKQVKMHRPFFPVPSDRVRDNAAAIQWVNRNNKRKNLVFKGIVRWVACYVKGCSGFSIGGVGPIGWLNTAKIIIDEALNDYEIVWAAAGHPHAVFPTTYEELSQVTSATQMRVAD